MSKLIEEKLETSVQSSIDNEINKLKLKTAYDYLNQISFTVEGTSSKTIELLSDDAIWLLGNSRMTINEIFNIHRRAENLSEIYQC